MRKSGVLTVFGNPALFIYRYFNSASQFDGDFFPTILNFTMVIENPQ